MALVTAKGVSSLAVALLARNLALPMTVMRVPAGEFRGPSGGTVTVRVRQPRTAQVRGVDDGGEGTSINYSAINETPVDVSLAHLYDATRISDEDYSLRLVDFGSQITQPQVAAVGVGAEDQLAAAMNGLASDGSLSGTSPAFANIDEALRTAREALTQADCPQSERYLAVAPDTMSAILDVDKFVRADATGDSVPAVKSATMGRVYGMTVIESNALTPGTGLAYHRSAFAFATAVPVAPRGANDSDVARYGGIAVRQIFQYQPDLLSDASVVSTFAGASAIEGAIRAFKFDGAGA